MCRSTNVDHAKSRNLSALIKQERFPTYITGENNKAHLRFREIINVLVNVSLTERDDDHYRQDTTQDPPILDVVSAVTQARFGTQAPDTWKDNFQEREIARLGGN